MSRRRQRTRSAATLHLVANLGDERRKQFFVGGGAELLPRPGTSAGPAAAAHRAIQGIQDVAPWVTMRVRRGIE